VEAVAGALAGAVGTEAFARKRGSRTRARAELIKIAEALDTVRSAQAVTADALRAVTQRVEDLWRHLDIDRR